MRAECANRLQRMDVCLWQDWVSVVIYLYEMRILLKF